MTFHEDFTLQLRANLADTLGLPSALIYVARQPQRPSKPGLEVWIEPDAVPEFLGLRSALHTYLVHFRVTPKPQPDGTGAEQLERIQDALEGLRKQLDAPSPFARAVPALLVLQVAELRGLDEDDVLAAVLRIRVLELPR